MHYQATKKASFVLLNLSKHKKNKDRKRNKKHTFSPFKSVNANVENIGSGGLAVAGQHSTTAPMGRQNNGTESGNGNSVWSCRGYLLIISK